MLGQKTPMADRAASGRTNAETLSYVTDIIDELKRLADKSRYRTLGAILAAALAEARLQSDESER